MPFTFNYAKIILGVIFDFFLGGFWFSQSGFAKPWMEETGITESKINEAIKSGKINMGRTFGIQIFMNILGIIGQFVLLNVLSPTNIFESLVYSYAIWCAFCAPGHLRCVLWEFKSFKYFLINAGYKLVSMLVLSIMFYV